MLHAEQALPSIVSSLGGKQVGEGYLCKCPAHDDGEASLSVKEKDGKLLFKCFAGCSYESIRDALRGRGLLPEWKEKEEKKKAPAKKKSDGWGAGEAQSVASEKVTSIGPTYEYHNEQGEVVFWKQRKYPKGYLVWRFKEGEKIWNLTGIAQPIFRLPAVLGAIKNGRDIHIAEGEKDAVTLERLGYVATTNHAGAGGWTLKNSAELKGAKRVFVHEDNDPAGRERIRKFTSLLAGYVEEVFVVRYADIKEHGDATDFFELFGEEKLRERIDSAEKLELDQVGWRQPEGREKALFDDYCSFVEKLPGFKKIVRCILSNELMVHLDDGEWDYLSNLEDYIKGHARRHGKFFTLDAFKHHLEVWRVDGKKKEMRVQVPEWDGIDRIAQMRDVFIFRNVTAETWYQLICQWGAGIFRRLKNPEYQPCTPIFQGDQGCGKDTLIKVLTGGLEDYVKTLSVSDFGLDEAFKQLHTALVFNIPEFDKTGKIDVASLKELITVSSTDKRLSYDKRDKKRRIRASFIASCNRKNAMVDDTGNRRYWFFECYFLGLDMVKNEEGARVGTGQVAKSYPGLWDRESADHEQKQIVAQFKVLADRRFKASPEALAEMNAVMMELTPKSLDDLIIEEWDAAIDSGAVMPERREFKTGRPVYSPQKASSILSDIQKNYGVSRKKLLGILKAKGRQRTYDGYRFYLGGREDL